MPSLPKTAALLNALADFDPAFVPDEVRDSLVAARDAWLSLEPPARQLAQSDILDAVLKAAGLRPDAAEKPSDLHTRLTNETAARLNNLGRQSGGLVR
jgi:hypothetical protein